MDKVTRDNLGRTLQKHEDELKEMRADLDTIRTRLEALRPMNEIEVLRVPEYTDYDCQEMRIIENGYIQESIHVRFHAALLAALLEDAGAQKIELVRDTPCTVRIDWSGSGYRYDDPRLPECEIGERVPAWLLPVKDGEAWCAKCDSQWCICDARPDDCVTVPGDGGTT